LSIRAPENLGEEKYEWSCLYFNPVQSPALEFFALRAGDVP
jgi:hypothetical protein